MSEEIKGVPAGVTQADLSESEAREGPQPPEVSNEPPKQPDKPQDNPAEAGDPKEETFVDPNAQQKPEEPNKEEEQPEAEPLKDYPEYDDPTAQAIATQLKSAGITVQEADALFAEAYETGDFSRIDFAKLKDKLGEAQANLVMIGFKEYYARTVGGVQEIVNTVYDTVGGEENFATIRTWAQAKEKADPEFKKTVDGLRKMLNMDSVAAKLAARELKALYEADPKNSSLSVVITTGDKAGNAAKFTPMSRDEYLKEMKLANDKGDYKRMQELDRIRLASRKAGH